MYNIVMGLFHLAQGAAMVALADPYAVPVTAQWMN